MSISYTAGETKVRPGVYQRYSKTGNDPVPGAVDGICALPMQSNWGPVGKVVKVTSVNALHEIFGNEAYSATNTVMAAEMMFNGGANTVYLYRMGTGGTAASIQLNKATETPSVKVEAIYPGTYALAVSLVPSVSDENTKILSVYHGTTLLESFSFDGDGTNDGKNLVAAVTAQGSDYITAQGHWTLCRSRPVHWLPALIRAWTTIRIRRHLLRWNRSITTASHWMWTMTAAYLSHFCWQPICKTHTRTGKWQSESWARKPV